MQVKLKDIAKKSGFSITTVSRALAGYDDVNEQTRQQIIDLAVAMGYQPNMVARQLRNQRTHTLGMIIPASDHTLSDDYFNEWMMSVGHAASKRGYDFLISAQSPDEEMSAYHRIVGGRRVDGIVMARLRQHDLRIQYLKERGMPFVVAGRYPGGRSDFAFVDVDSETGIRLLIAHLVTLGHQHIGFISSSEDLSYTAYRIRGYRTALQAAGLPYREDYIIYGNLKRESGYYAAQELLERYPYLTAIAACNDAMALGAMMAIRDSGRMVGRDVALTGFDDIPSAAYANPSLTTIRQPLQDIGQLLVDLLIQLIEEAPEDYPHILLPPEVIIRDSTTLSRKEVNG